MSRAIQRGLFNHNTNEPEHSIYQVLLKKHHEANPKILFFHQLSFQDPQKFDIYYIDPDSRIACHIIAWNKIRKGIANEKVITEALILHGCIDPWLSSEAMHEFFISHHAHFTLDEIHEETARQICAQRGRRNAIMPSDNTDDPNVSVSTATSSSNSEDSRSSNAFGSRQ